MRSTPTRPVLRYHGGKWKLAPWIISHFPKHEIYVEPFGGAASVLLRKSRANRGEVYNELNGEITNLFRVIRQHGPELANLISLTPFSNQEFEDSYTPSDDPIEQARRTIVRSFMGFGSCVTASKKTGFRRFARKKGAAPHIEWVNYPESLIKIAERFMGVLIENQAAVDCIKTHDSIDTLFYIDPPYPHSLRYDTKMYQFEMLDKDHVELADVLHGVKGKVVLSGYECPLYEDLFNGWEKVTQKAYADGAKERKEVLWLNDAAAKSKPQLSIFG